MISLGSSRFVDVLVGQMISREGYLVGVVGAPGTGRNARDRSFFVLFETPSLSSAREVAQAFADLHGGQQASAPDRFCPCADCADQLAIDDALCAAAAGVCQGLVLSGDELLALGRSIDFRS